MLSPASPDDTPRRAGLAYVLGRLARSDSDSWTRSLSVHGSRTCSLPARNSTSHVACFSTVFWAQFVSQITVPLVMLLDPRRIASMVC